MKVGRNKAAAAVASSISLSRSVDTDWRNVLNWSEPAGGGSSPPLWSHPPPSGHVPRRWRRLDETIHPDSGAAAVLSGSRAGIISDRSDAAPVIGQVDRGSLGGPSPGRDRSVGDVPVISRCPGSWWCRRVLSCVPGSGARSGWLLITWPEVTRPLGATARPGPSTPRLSDEQLSRRHQSARPVARKKITIRNYQNPLNLSLSLYFGIMAKKQKLSKGG